MKIQIGFKKMMLLGFAVGVMAANASAMPSNTTKPTGKILYPPVSVDITQVRGGTGTSSTYSEIRGWFTVDELVTKNQMVADINFVNNLNQNPLKTLRGICPYAGGTVYAEVKSIKSDKREKNGATLYLQITTTEYTCYENYTPLSRR